MVLLRGLVVPLGSLVVPLRGHVVPLRSLVVTPRILVVPLRSLVVPLRGHVVPLRSLVVTPRILVVPLRSLVVPLRSLVVPLRGLVVPLRSLVVPLRSVVAPLISVIETEFDIFFFSVCILVASLMSSLHQLKADNSRLEERLSTLTNRKNQLLQVNARLATPMSCTSTSSTATPVTTKQSTLSTPGAVTAASQGSLSTETKTTLSSDGPRGSVSAGADGAPKMDVSPSTVQGKAPLSAGVKPATSVAGERRIPNGEVKGSKTKDQQVKRPEANLNTAQTVSSSVQKQPVKVNSLLLQPTKTALAQQALLAQLDKDKQQKQAPLNALPQVIVPAQPTSKATQQQQQQQQQQLQARFQPQHKIILPQPSPTTQGFSTSSFTSQPQQTANQQHVLLQLIQQQDDVHRLPGQNAAFSHDKTQLGAQQVQTQKLLPSTVPNQPFSAHSLSLSYPGTFLTFSDPMGLSGSRVDMMKAAHLAPLQMVTLDNSQTGPKERSQVSQWRTIPLAL